MTNLTQKFSFKRASKDKGLLENVILNQVLNFFQDLAISGSGRQERVFSEYFLETIDK